MRTFLDRLDGFDAALHRWLVAHSLTMLRISLGVIFLGFGLLKYFPGVSPAQGLVERTTDVLFAGLVPGPVALAGIATLECTIGLCLILGRGMRLAIYLLAVQMVGILSPLVFFPGRLFAGPHGAPTLEGQYVLKDIVLATATMVIATTLRGGRLERGHLPAVLPGRTVKGRTHTPQERLSVVLEGLRGDRSVAAVCARHQIDAADYHRWHRALIAGATAELETAEEPADAARVAA